MSVDREIGEKYLKEHNIDDALRLMRENLIKVQPENPWTFMIDSMFFSLSNDVFTTRFYKNFDNLYFQQFTSTMYYSAHKMRNEREVGGATIEE